MNRETRSLLKRLKERREVKVAFLATGKCKSLEEYARRSGECVAIQEVMDEITNGERPAADDRDDGIDNVDEE